MTRQRRRSVSTAYSQPTNEQHTNNESRGDVGIFGYDIPCNRDGLVTCVGNRQQNLELWIFLRKRRLEIFKEVMVQSLERPQDRDTRYVGSIVRGERGAWPKTIPAATVARTRRNCQQSAGKLMLEQMTYASCHPSRDMPQSMPYQPTSANEAAVAARSMSEEGRPGSTLRTPAVLVFRQHISGCGTLQLRAI